MVEAVNLEISPLFAWKCLKAFWGKAWPVFLLFLLCLLVFCVCGMVQKQQTCGLFFVLCSCLLFVACYNPVSVRILVPRIVDRKIYYRLFWLIPAAPGLAFLAVSLIARLRAAAVRAAVCALAAAAFLFLLPTNMEILKGMPKPENVYKVPDAVVFACDEIHKDFGDDGNPRTVWAFELETYVRMYDASIFLVIKRNTRLQYSGSITVPKKADTAKYRRRVTILDALNDAKEVPVRDFRKALKKTKTDYLIIPADYTSHDFMKEAGLRVVAANDDVVIYRFER